MTRILPQKKHIAVLAAAIALAGTSISAEAATQTWANVGSDWATNANWSVAAPASNNNDIARFNADVTVTPIINLASPRTVGAIQVTSAVTSPFTIQSTGASLLSIGTQGGIGIDMSAAGADLTIAPTIRSQGNGVFTFANIAANRTLTINNFSNFADSNSVFNYNGAGTVKFASTGQLVIRGDAAAGGRTLTLGGSATIVVDALLVDGTATGNNFQYNGTGSLYLNNTNTYTRPTVIQSGSVYLGTNAPSNAAGALGVSTTAVTLGLNSTVQSTQASLYINGAYTVGRNITEATGATNSSFTIGGSNTSGTAIYAGNITLTKATNLVSATGGAVNFNGAWTMNNNAVNFGAVGYAGKVTIAGTMTTTAAVNVNVGKVVITGSITGGTNGISVASGATLAGTGTIGKNTTILGGATLQPGASPGTLTYNNANLAFNDNGNLNLFVLDAVAAAGTGYSTNNITGTGILDLAGLTGTTDFNINLWSLASISPDVNGDANNFDNTVPHSWTVVSTPTPIVGFDATRFTVNTAAINGTGGFSNALAGGSFSVALTDGGTDLSVVFTPEVVVPEPASLGLLALGALGLMRRRR